VTSSSAASGQTGPIQGHDLLEVEQGGLHLVALQWANEHKPQVGQQLGLGSPFLDVVFPEGLKPLGRHFADGGGGVPFGDREQLYGFRIPTTSLTGTVYPCLHGLNAVHQIDHSWLGV